MKLWTWSRFEPTPPMSTYLVAWIITDFAVTEISVKTRAGTKVPIRLWTKPSDAYRATASLDMSRRVFTALDQYFRVPYSLPKMDIVALPFETGDFAGMENWGLITVKWELVPQMNAQTFKFHIQRTHVMWSSWFSGTKFLDMVEMHFNQEQSFHGFQSCQSF